MPIFRPRRFRREKDQKKKDIPKGLFQKCPGCGEINAELNLIQRYQVCPKCDHHFPLSVEQRIDLLLDAGSFKALDDELESADPLNFKGYADKLKNLKKAEINDAITTGTGEVTGVPIVLGVMDFRCLGASMGSVVGEKITRAIELATEEKRGVVLVCTSGGARMHEGILSLMQMAKTSGALARHSEAGLPYIPILTNPTTGGVTASFATLGDVILAEPKSMIGFAGPRVVRETTHQSLPPRFQTAEFLLEHGLVDRIVDRGSMKETLGFLLRFMLPQD